MIDIQNVSLHHSGGFRLQPISLRFDSEQTHVWLGSSGSGKTSLLKAILGLNAIDTGSIRIFGEEVNAETQVNVARMVGYVPQEGGLFPHMTNAQNVCLPGRLAGMTAAAMQARLHELGDLVGLHESDLSRFPSELSGGQRQRVSLMRALFIDPKLIVLDEPLNALDPLIRSKLQEDLKRIFNRLKKLVIIVTHDLGEAAYFGHTISLFHEGRLLQSASLPELAQNPADPFVTEFLNAYRNFDFHEQLRKPT